MAEASGESVWRRWAEQARTVRLSGPADRVRPTAIQIQLGGQAFDGGCDGVIGRRRLEEERTQRREVIGVGEELRFGDRGSAQVDIHGRADARAVRGEITGIVLADAGQGEAQVAGRG